MQSMELDAGMQDFLNRTNLKLGDLSLEVGSHILLPLLAREAIQSFSVIELTYNDAWDACTRMLYARLMPDVTR